MMTDYRMLFEGLAVAASSVLFLGAALLLHGALRSRSAAFRHLVLLGAFAGLLVLPVLSGVLPTWNLPDSPAIPGARSSAAHRTSLEIRGAANELGGLPLAAASPSPAREARLARPAAPGIFERAWWIERWGGLSPWCPLLAAALWALGALTVIVVQVVRWTAAGFVAGTAVRIEDDSLSTLAGRIGGELGLARRPALVRSDIVPVSMVWGVGRPCIVLPAEQVDWPIDKTEAVLRHELAHVKRHDNLFHLIAGLACAIYWFNPLVWTAIRRLHFEREVACDDCVLEAGTAASAYAKHLMEVSMKLTGPKSMRIVPAAMAHSSDVKRRLLRILDPETKRRPVRGRMLALAIAAMIVIAAPVSAFRIWSDERPAPPAPPIQPAPLPPPAEAPAPPAEAVAPPVEAAEALAPAAPLAPATSPAPAPAPRVRRIDVRAAGEGDEEGMWSIDGTIKIEEDRVSIDGTMKNGKSDLSVDAARVVFDPDLAEGFRFDSRGGSLVVKETRDGETTVYRARPKTGAKGIDVSCAVNGKTRAADAEDRAHLREIAREIYETFAEDGRMSLRSIRPDLPGLATEQLRILGDRDFVISGADTLDGRGAVVLRRGTGRDLEILRLRDKDCIALDAKRLARESEALAREFERARIHPRLNADSLYRESMRLYDHDIQRAIRLDVDSISREAMRLYYREARDADDMGSVLDLFEEQRGEILDAMSRLRGDARREYRETVVSSYESMIARLDRRIAELEAQESSDPSVAGKIETNTRLRDSLRETIERLRSM